MRKTYYVYIMANHTRMMYVGVTNSLERRVLEHKAKVADAHTKRYDMTRLVYFEDYADVRDAIAREKQLKGWRRARKIELIRAMNPRWRDLADDWD
jgi:putative endonuclease